jgi:hypothetical protein
MGQSVNWNNTNTYSLAGSITKFMGGGHSLGAGVDVRLTHYVTYSPAIRLPSRVLRISQASVERQFLGKHQRRWLRHFPPRHAFLGQRGI